MYFLQKKNLKYKIYIIEEIQKNFKIYVNGELRKITVEEPIPMAGGEIVKFVPKFKLFGTNIFDLTEDIGIYFYNYNNEYSHEVASEYSFIMPLNKYYFNFNDLF